MVLVLVLVHAMHLLARLGRGGGAARMTVLRLAARQALEGGAGGFTGRWAEVRRDDVRAADGIRWGSQRGS